MICYKILLVYGDVKYSFNCSLYPSPRRLIYKEGEYTSPEIPGSKLFVFKELENAIQYVKGFLHHSYENIYEIWECECPDLEFQYPLVNYSESNLVKFWSSYNKDEYIFDTDIVGSYVTSELKLVKEVKNWRKDDLL